MKTFAENVSETSSTLGTATYELSGSVLGCRSFVDAGFVDGDQPYYCVRNKQNTKYEYNRNAAFNAGPDTLARGTFISSNANSPVSWGSNDIPVTIYIPSAAELLEALWRYWNGTVFRLPGMVERTRVQVSATQSITQTSLIPDDNTIPQNTEGHALAGFDVAMTVRSVTSRIRLNALIVLTDPNEAEHIKMAAFIDSVANAVAVSIITTPVTSYMVQVRMDVEVPNPGVGAHTYKLRASKGSTNSGTFTINTHGGAAKFGGTMFSFFEVEEIFQ